MRYNEINSFAARVCGIKPATVAVVFSNPPTQFIGHYYEYQYECGEDGLLIDCKLEYEAATRGSDTEPGEDESIKLVFALVNGVDISFAMAHELKELIEDEALASMKKEAHDQQFELAYERAQERAECES